MTPHSISFTAYDTPCSAEITVGQGIDAPAVLAGVRQLALDVQRCLSMYDGHSELATLCRNYRPGQAMPLSPMLADFLAVTLEVSRLSDGALDPTVGPLVRLWDFTAKDPAPPAPADIKKALTRVGWQHLQLDHKAAALTFHRPGMVIDPGASGKGFALGLLVDYLRQYGVRHGIVNLGGNLYVLGPGPGQSPRPWRVGIRHPQQRDGTIGWVEMQDAAIATSAGYEHCFAKDGVTYHHLLHPRTGHPVPLALQSLSIVSSRPVYTDLLSTALFIMGLQEGQALVETLRRQSGESIEYVAVPQQGEFCASPGVHFHPCQPQLARQGNLCYI